LKTDFHIVPKTGKSFTSNIQELEIPTTWGVIRVTLNDEQVVRCTLPRLTEEPAIPFQLIGLKSDSIHVPVPMAPRPADETPTVRGCYAANRTNGSYPPRQESIFLFLQAVFKGFGRPGADKMVSHNEPGQKPELSSIKEIPLVDIERLPGTDFQRSVWREISEIPHGEVRTYGELAKSIGHPHAVRATGSACGANPVPLFIPCHRVVSAHGLGGFAPGLPWKQLLLHLEGVI